MSPKRAGSRRARRSRFILPVIARSCVALTAIIVAGGTLALGVSAAVQPNIVFILADDLDRATTAVQPAVMPNLMQLVAKAGAEAVYAVGLPDGRGVALKISDGSPRARAVAMAGVLMRLGFDHDLLSEQASAPVLGHGERVGEIRPVAGTLARLAT